MRLADALTEQGLGPALTGVAKRLPIEVEAKAPNERLPENAAQRRLTGMLWLERKTFCGS